ncbi:hypothetical protein HJC23_007967 [Cyclotella cryptica]|uniref:Myb-like domain-containing protein n=1 Tax=Cyclotella cryptica TaxID=29204 RepID=A0ABD3P5U6_9STRA
MRWKAELNKFHDLKVNVVSSNEWRSSPTCDVSVCDYLTFLEIIKNDIPLTTTLGCLILDLRHSAFDSDGMNQSTLLGTDIFEWWDSIIKFVSKFPQSNRLIIEHLGITLKDVHTRRRECDDNARHCAKLLAMKVAFVYHPFLFYSQTVSTGKRVVSWAKSQKTLPRSIFKLNIRDDRISALQRIRSILDELLLSVCFTIDSVAIENGVVQDNLHSIMWELRDCPLTPLQNRAYRSHCLDIEGSQLIKPSQPVNLDIFSHDRLNESAKPQTPSVVSNVLDNLHKVCIHSNLDEIVTTLPSFQRHGFQLRRSASRSGSILLRGATSEPNMEVARSIMEKSSKMKELLSVLTNECGFSADIEPEAPTNSRIEDESETGGVPEMAPRKKIVILASLVEAQMLTSFFLSCVGLHHEVFITTGFLSSNLSRDPNLSNLPIAAWNWSQSILSQFNTNEDADGCIHGTCRIIISSPATLSSLNGGICPTSADVVINIDEDWNGREATHVTSIAKKICCKKQNDTATSSFCKFVKIVCKNTFEEEMIRGRKEHDVSIVQHSSHDENDTKCFQFKPDNSPKEINGCNSVKITPKRISSVNSNDAGMDAAIGPVVLRERAQPDLGFSAMDHIHNTCSLHFTQIPSNDTYSSPLLTKFAPGTGFALSTVDNEVPYSYGLVLPVKKVVGALGLHSPSKAPLLVIEPAQTLSSSTSPPIWHYIQLFDQFSYDMSRSVSELTPGRDGNSPAQNNVTQNRDSGITEKSTSSKNVANNIAPPFNASSLLIYELPQTLSKERASFVSKEPSNSCMEYFLGRKRRFDELQGTSSTLQLDTTFDLNRLILGFSTARNSVFPFVPDNNHGVEPLVYGPSFLPLLLNTIRKTIRNSIAPSSSMKRKATVPESSGVDQKRLKFSDPLQEVRSTIPQHQLRTYFTSYDEQLIDDEGDSDCFELDVETNPYSGLVGNEDTDTIFWGRRLESDAKEIATRQQWPAANSIILVVRKHQMRIGNFKREKKTIGQLSMSSLAANASQNHVSAPKVLNSEPEQQPADHDERKADVKKMKKHQQSLFTAAQDKIAVLHFKKDKPLGRSFAIREGIRFNLAASLVGSARLRFRLSDALSNSYIHASFLLSQHSSMVQYPTAGNTDFGPFLFGERARQNVSKLIRRERSRSGITLPMGVKRPRLARKFTSSLEETDEPWTDKEDTLLQESVAKYGMNWQLASRAVSNFNICRPPNVLLASRRSPNQCQLRWESTMTENGDARKESAASCDSLANTKILLFPGHSINDTKEYFVYRSSLTMTPDEKQNGPNYYGPWIRNPNSAPSHNTPLGNSNGAGKSAFDRIKQLKETSKKRRVTTTTIPGATTVGNETTVRLVPVHASHRESIQAATASWPQPRKEMWPMEFLDYTAKFKASAPVVDSNKSTQEASRVIPSHTTRPSSIQQHHPAHPVPYTPAYSNVMQGNPPYFGMFPNQHRPHYPPKPPS